MRTKPFPGLVSGTMSRLSPKPPDGSPQPLPEHERWAHAFRVWRSLCNHSSYPQSGETHLLLLQILRLLLMSNRISHNLERTNWKCMSRTPAEEWVSVLFNQKYIFTGLPVLRFSGTALWLQLWCSEATPWKTLRFFLTDKHLFCLSVVLQSSPWI